MGTAATADVGAPLAGARMRAVAGRVIAWKVRAGVPFLTIAGGALASGASEPTSWGWIAFALFAVAGVAAFAAPVQVGWPDRFLLLGLAALLALSAASNAWTDDLSRTWVETERFGVDLAVVLAIMLLATRASLAVVLGGVWAASAAISLYALLHRLYPVRFGISDVGLATGYRLADPFPYWNMLAALAAIGIVLGLGIGARATHLLARAASAASLVPLSLTLYFTFSRGAVGALAVALLALLVLDARRVHLTLVALILAAPTTAALVVASRMRGMTSPTATLNAAAHDGRLLAVIAGVLSLLTAFLVLVVVAIERRRSASRRARTILGVVLAVSVLGALASAGVARGGPAAAWRSAVASFNGAPVTARTDLNDRMFNLSSNGRSDLWTVARAMARSAPVKGRGAGTFESYWTSHRPIALDTPWAHDAYLQLLAELGPGALAALALAILGVLVAAVRGRRTPLVAAAFSGFLLVLVHAIVDTDLQSPPVMIAALTCAACVVAGARAPRDADDPGPARIPTRVLLLVVAVAGASTSAYVLRGDLAVDSASANVVAGRPCAALADATAATVRAPWLAATWREVAAVDEVLGDTDGAVAAYRQAIRRSPTDLRLRLDLVGVTRGADRAAASAALIELDPMDGINLVAAAPIPGNVRRTVCR